MKKRILSIFLFVVMAVNLLPVTTSAAQIVKSKKLVLIQRWDGNWYAFETLVDEDEKGFMIDLKTFSYFMGYDCWYTYSDNTITVAKSKDRFITYKLNQKKYTYQSNSSKKVTKEAKYKAYYDKDHKIYYVHATTLGNLCNYKYFEGKDKTAEYGKKGFTRIVCFSDKRKITMLPDIKKVKNDAGLTWNDTFVSFDDIKEPGVAEIFGLTFKAPESFVNTKYLYWDNDPEFIDIKSRFNEIVSYNGLATLEFDGLKLKATFNSMSYSFDYDFEASGGGEKIQVLLS